MFQHFRQPLISALLLKTHFLVVTFNTTLQALPATLLGKESGVSSSTIQGFLCSLSRSLSLSLLATDLSLKPCALQTILHLSSLSYQSLFCIGNPFLKCVVAIRGVSFYRTGKMGKLCLQKIFFGARL